MVLVGIIPEYIRVAHKQSQWRQIFMNRESGAKQRKKKVL